MWGTYDVGDCSLGWTWSQTGRSNPISFSTIYLPQFAAMSILRLLLGLDLNIVVCAGGMCGIVIPTVHHLVAISIDTVLTKLTA